MNFPSSWKCGLLEAGIIEHLMVPGTFLGTKDTEVKLS